MKENQVSEGEEKTLYRGLERKRKRKTGRKRETGKIARIKRKLLEWRDRERSVDLWIRKGWRGENAVWRIRKKNARKKRKREEGKCDNEEKERVFEAEEKTL